MSNRTATDTFQTCPNCDRNGVCMYPGPCLTCAINRSRAAAIREKQTALRPLDPSFWRRVGTGYEQQAGRARLGRLKNRTKTTGWALTIDGVHHGSWPSFGSAKRRALEISSTLITEGKVV